MTAEDSDAQGGTVRLRKGVSVIGLGNWGSSLAAAAVGSGIPLVEVVVRKASSRRRFGAVAVRILRDAALDAEVLGFAFQMRRLPLSRRRSSLGA